MNFLPSIVTEAEERALVDFHAAQQRLNAAVARGDRDAALTHLQSMCVARDRFHALSRPASVAA